MSRRANPKGEKIDTVAVAIPLEGHRVGGSHISASTMATALNRWTPVDARLILGTKGPLSEILDSSGTHYEVLSTRFTGQPLTRLRYAAFLAGDMPRIAHFLREHEINILHSGDSAIHVTWGAAARLVALPHVWHQRGIKWPRRVPSDPATLDVVAISNFVLNSLPPHPFHSKRVIYNPVEIRQIPHRTAVQRREEIQDRVGLQETNRLVGFVANLVAYKRPDFFISVAEELLKTETDLHFIIAGREHDWKRQQLEAMASQIGIGQHVTVLGFEPNPLELMSALDLIIVPAVNEPFGRTLPEAMQLGVPTVASDSGGHPESFPDGVRMRLADPMSPRDFAAKARKLLAAGTSTVNETRSLTKHAEETFSPQRHAQSVHALYLERLESPQA